MAALEAMRELDVDVMLSEEERLPCTFLQDGANLGSLDQHVAGKDLPANTKVDLPLWLSVQFMKKNMVEMEFPKHYQRKMREELHAGAEAVDLRSFTQYFFEVGVKLAVEMTSSDESSRNDLMKTLRNAFSGGRYHNLIMHSLAQGLFDDSADYSQTLTIAELVLFQEGLNAAKNMHQWRSLESNILQKASVLGRRGASGHQSSSGGDKRTRREN